MKLSAYIAHLASAIERFGDREVEFSTDVSTGDADYDRRAFGRPTGEVVSTPSTLVLLAEGRINAESVDLFRAADILRHYASTALITNPSENRKVLALSAKLRVMAGS